ncbi:GNAT family N-acetyltransferase [Bradyrhizobium sp. LHD-71]|uniref:GNAT family N-acetyltransferase n=1 Tax=Bradyrhizobium sp. LHD-71 TaxID=3072141 RepID=UPI00280E66F5|nr:GNAT family N-acetyltransferase [Bradyrhizobium sp. LHD-71]MDQ8728703.1 GNAT family N-acetyltransferase [Bradyrhizobium sp. LHD-71]
MSLPASPLAPAEQAVSAGVDAPVDYAETARIGNEAFSAEDVFTPDHMRWLYEQCFSEGATVVSLRTAQQKVGQFVIVRQEIVADGVPQPAAQLVDLFVLKAFRSRQTLASLYDAVADQCRTQHIRFAIGMPNEKAIAANDHFFGLKPHLWLDIRAGLALRGPPSTLTINERFSKDRAATWVNALHPYLPPLSEQGVFWTADSLCTRLTNPRFSYGIHATNDLLLISSPRERRGVPYTLLCGFFPRAGAHISRADVQAVTRAACRVWQRPLFVYPGIHRRMPDLPGWRLPRRLRPSTMLVQLRDFSPEMPPLVFDRYQPLDSDFA